MLPAVPIVLKLIALGVAKKGVMYGIARKYGIPRVYRRVLEVNRSVMADKSNREYVRGRVENAFRFPNTVYNSMKDSKVQKVTTEFYHKTWASIFGKK